jgi:hypothetical protein
MKRRMEWLWETTVEGTDEKGRPTKTPLFVDTPVDGARKMRVAVYRSKTVKPGKD